MSNKLYVGSLPYSTTDDDLAEMFKAVGPVASAKVIQDRDSGRSKGFAFVEMTNAEDAQKAIQQLNGQSLGGRTITVTEARPQETGGRSGGGSRSGGGGGGFGGGRGGNGGGGGFGGGRGGNSGGGGGFGGGRGGNSGGRGGNHGNDDWN